MPFLRQFELFTGLFCLIVSYPLSLPLLDRLDSLMQYFPKRREAET